jgi:hypothetical protein
MTTEEISSFELRRTTLGKGAHKMLSSPLDIIKGADDILHSPGLTNHSAKMREVEGE